MLQRLTIIKKHSTKVAHYVYDKEYRSFFAAHGEVAAARIAFHWVISSCLDKQIVDFAWRAKVLVGGIC